MKKPAILLFLFFTWLLPLPVSAQVVKEKYGRIDTAKVISQAELKSIADRTFNQFYKGIYHLGEKELVEKQFKILEDNPENLLSLAQSMSSEGVVLEALGTSKNVSMIFASKAASLFPADTLIVNNFGAMLRMNNNEQISLPVLLYAKKLYPASPVILTNLANTLLELGDDYTAEIFYRRALVINPEFTLANQGLVAVFLKRKNLKEAMEQMIKTAKANFSPSVKKTFDNTKHRKGYSTPDMQSELDRDAPSDADKNQIVEQLQLPEPGNWYDVKSFTKDESIGKVKAQLSDYFNKSLNAISDLSKKVSKMSKEGTQKWYEDEIRPGRTRYQEKGEFAMNLMEMYFDDQIEKINDTYLSIDKINSGNYGKAIEQEASVLESKTKMVADDPIVMGEIYIAYCHKIKNIQDNYFKTWKEATHKRHKAYNDLLITYWVYCEQYLNRTYNLEDFERLNNQRKMYLAGHLSGLYMEYGMRQLTEGLLLGAMTRNCPDKIPPPPPPEHESELSIPNKNAPDCPFDGNKLKIGLVPCSMSVDCESVEAGCESGFAGAAKWNYRKKEVTLFIGIGGSVHYGANYVNVGAKAGIEITFDNNAQVSDIGFKAETGASGSFRDVGFGKTFETRVTAATGVSSTLMDEYSIRL